MLAILAEFPDRLHRIDASRFAPHLFGATGETMRTYYADVSGGRLDVDGDVHGWFVLPSTHAFYSGGANGVGTYPNNAQRMAEDAVAAAVAGGVDLADYDADGDGEVDALLVIHAGEGYEWAGSTAPALTPVPDPTAINSHKWSVVDGDFGAGLPRVADYFTCPEMQRARPAFFPAWTDSMATIGVFCHELGHVLGLPDFYDVETAISRVGSWEVMDAGLWSFVAGDAAHSLPGSLPSGFSAWPRMFLNWASPAVLGPATGDVVEATLTLGGPGAAGEPLQLRANPFGVDWSPDGGGTGEFFVAEVRTRTGWDAGLPGEGLLLYHVDESRRGNRRSESADGAGLLLLVPQDGEVSLGQDAADPWPGTRTAFGAATVPSSHLHDGSSSGVELPAIEPLTAGSVSVVAVVSNLTTDLPLPFARPHPFRPARDGEVGIVLSLDATPPATRVDLFDVRGRRVRTLDAGSEFGASGRIARWDGRNEQGTSLPSGVYLYRSDRGAVGKVVLLRE